MPCILNARVNYSKPAALWITEEFPKTHQSRMTSTFFQPGSVPARLQPAGASVMALIMPLHAITDAGKYLRGWVLPKP